MQQLWGSKHQDGEFSTVPSVCHITGAAACSRGFKVLPFCMVHRLLKYTDITCSSQDALAAKAVEELSLEFIRVAALRVETPVVGPCSTPAAPAGPGLLHAVPGMAALGQLPMPDDSTLANVEVCCELQSCMMSANTLNADQRKL